jgi:RHH-type proline utilization regulon transcriptional repressor/proline dehydrogenase/delta 1-pyrroline-5-carboxylate dehydrogenase
VTAAFRNEPLTEFRREQERQPFAAALAHLDAEGAIEVPAIVAGERRGGEGTFTSIDPGEPGRIVARASAAGAGDVDAAVAAAGSAGCDWGRRAAAERAAVLIGAAAELRARRHHLAALEVRECAKPWAEADADVCEAIDYLEYYARAAEELAAVPELLQVPGEHNGLHYRPRGVAAVIAPWNFPLAIATGMTAAALAAGNGVCLKPAEQSPACALALHDALESAGLPSGVLALLPGEGAVGAALVGHPGVHTIAFTGSAAVGLEILRRAAELAPGQRHIKRVVAEMGGKNCVIVDADADLDDVVPAVLDSAFAFAGQKCSAASRILIHERIFDALEARLRGALETLLVGPAERFDTDVPALIEAAARDRVERTLEQALAEGAKVSRAGAIPDGEGFYAAPALVVGASAASAVVAEEIFGPVLSVEPVAGVEAACDAVEAQPQALTGGLFSRNPRTVEAVVRRTPVGNFYVNRAITGAMVGRQPFGGNGLSGSGTKAGGPDYLKQFAQALVVSESTVRHGLAV